ncbi:hypothetical protein RA268_27935, partial [Pseudomonas syringae pv. tagetis]
MVFWFLCGVLVVGVVWCGVGVGVLIWCVRFWGREVRFLCGVGGVGACSHVDRLGGKPDGVD